jgi:hypothetical protein
MWQPGVPPPHGVASAGPPQDRVASCSVQSGPSPALLDSRHGEQPSRILPLVRRVVRMRHPVLADAPRAMLTDGAAANLLAPPVCEIPFQNFEGSCRLDGPTLLLLPSTSTSLACTLSPPHALLFPPVPWRKELVLCKRLPLSFSRRLYQHVTPPPPPPP